MTIHCTERNDHKRARLKARIAGTWFERRVHFGRPDLCEHTRRGRMPLCSHPASEGTIVKTSAAHVREALLFGFTTPTRYQISVMGNRAVGNACKRGAKAATAAAWSAGAGRLIDVAFSNELCVRSPPAAPAPP